MENPAQGGVSECRAGWLDTPDDSRPVHDLQAAGRALGSALVCLLDMPSTGNHAADLAVILRCRLDADARLWLAGAALLSLPPDVAEELAEAVLHDLRAGPPVPPFLDVREDARDWATFASPGERKAYLGAIWGRLPETERVSFLHAARRKRRAA